MFPNARARESVLRVVHLIRHATRRTGHCQCDIVAREANEPAIETEPQIAVKSWTIDHTRSPGRPCAEPTDVTRPFANLLKPLLVPSHTTPSLSSNMS